MWFLKTELRRAPASVYNVQLLWELSTHWKQRGISDEIQKQANYFFKRSFWLSSEQSQDNLALRNQVSNAFPSSGNFASPSLGPRVWALSWGCVEKRVQGWKALRNGGGQDLEERVYRDIRCHFWPHGTCWLQSRARPKSWESTKWQLREYVERETERESVFSSLVGLRKNNALKEEPTSWLSTRGFQLRLI